MHLNGHVVVVNVGSKRESSTLNKFDKPELISRSLFIKNEWREVLDCGCSDSLEVIIATYTEDEVSFINEDILYKTPTSFPGQLVSLLYSRYKHVNENKEKIVTVVLTELAPADVEKLKDVTLELAHLNGLNYSFLDWIDTKTLFKSGRDEIEINERYNI